MKQIILFLSSYPPRESSIASFTSDLITAMKQRINSHIDFKIAALVDGKTTYEYGNEVMYQIDVTQREQFKRVAEEINQNKHISAIMIEHEFGLYQEEYLLNFMQVVRKPVGITFHTILPYPGKKIKTTVLNLTEYAEHVIVMTEESRNILIKDYSIPNRKIQVIPHGTHLGIWYNFDEIKKKKKLANNLILSTFGMLTPDKSIETALEALPAIVNEFPSVIYFIIGETHPNEKRQKGEEYRKFLESKVHAMNLESHVRFIDHYLPLEELLDHLMATDVYLFTSKDPLQAVSGTLSYAMGCGCPIVSTPIPYAKEMLSKDTGILVDFENPEQLSTAVITLLKSESLRNRMSIKALQKTRVSDWHNVALKTLQLFQKSVPNLKVYYSYPELTLQYVKKLTSSIGIVHYAHIDTPDYSSGYVLEDNALALITTTKHYIMKHDPSDKKYIDIYLNAMHLCQRPNGVFVNKLNTKGVAFIRNETEGIADSNAMAIWALGYFISQGDKLPKRNVDQAIRMMKNVLPHIYLFTSSRAMSYLIKGLYFYNLVEQSENNLKAISFLSDKLLEFYNQVADKKWEWFESYLTYANATLPEAMLYSWKATGNVIYRIVAHSTFDFLLKQLFKSDQLHVLPNSFWFKKLDGQHKFVKQQQPVDVSYLTSTLDLFYCETHNNLYKDYLMIAFSWFFGNNESNLVLYNDKTGGCYDGIVKHNVNLNQNTESTLYYLMSRLTVEKYLSKSKINKTNQIITGNLKAV